MTQTDLFCIPVQLIGKEAEVTGVLFEFLELDTQAIGVIQVVVVPLHNDGIACFFYRDISQLSQAGLVFNVEYRRFLSRMYARRVSPLRV